MERAVGRGLAKRNITKVEHIGIDEKSFIKGHNYLTALNDLDEGRFLDVVPERTEAACRKLIETALPDYCRRFKIEAVAVDMWPAFANAIKAPLPNASVVYNRFHVSGYLGGAPGSGAPCQNTSNSSRRVTTFSPEAVTACCTQVKPGPKSTRVCWMKSVGVISKPLVPGPLRMSFASLWQARNSAFAELIFENWYGWAVRSQQKSR